LKVSALIQTYEYKRGIQGACKGQTAVQREGKHGQDTHGGKLLAFVYCVLFPEISNSLMEEDDTISHILQLDKLEL